MLCLTGDVMTGRGVDQILPAAGDPRLWEQNAASARDYVALAEAASGPIPQPVDWSWPWGDALRVLDELAPDLRIVNLETSITSSDDFQPAKAVLYRMHPGNVACLTVARLDACTLANNHVMDFGVGGLEETLDVLTRAGLGPVGAGCDEQQAWRPVVLTAGGQRVLVWSVGSASSGVPHSWAAGPEGPGVAFLSEHSDADADALCERVRRVKQPGDIAVVSVHWGSNWGYHVPRAQVRFAHRLIDSGVDVVHGHSSHHPRPVEVYRDRLVLYGCGDLINDYEGIQVRSGSVVTCGCCTSPGSIRPDGSTSCRWCRSSRGSCACGTPRSRTPGGCTGSCARSAVASDRGSTSRPTPACCCTGEEPTGGAAMVIESLGERGVTIVGVDRDAPSGAVAGTHRGRSLATVGP